MSFRSHSKRRVPVPTCTGQKCFRYCRVLACACEFARIECDCWITRVFCVLKSSLPLAQVKCQWKRRGNGGKRDRKGREQSLQRAHIVWLGCISLERLYDSFFTALCYKSYSKLNTCASSCTHLLADRGKTDRVLMDRAFALYPSTRSLRVYRRLFWAKLVQLC